MPGTGAADARAASEVTVRLAPDWVTDIGIVAAGASYWAWVVTSDLPPAEGPGRPATPFSASGQLVLDLPDGRYAVDVFDTCSKDWISRESCAASPLVAGLPRRQGALVLHIRPIAV